MNRARGTSRALVAGGVALALVAAARLVPGGAEAWARRLYPALSHAIVPLSERAAWPWTPLAALAVSAATVALIRTAPTQRRAWARAAGVVLLLAAGFEAAWGLHAARPGAPVRLGLAPVGAAARVPADDAELRPLAERLENVLSRDEPAGPLDESAAQAAVRRELSAFASGVRLPQRVKRLPPGWLGALGVAGVISPWTLEAHVDGGLPAWARVAASAHELAHLSGFASEADAELLGLLAALRADHPHARYAGALRAWASLPATVRTPSAVPARAEADLRALREALASRRDAWADPAWRAYDLWLRSRGQEEGVSGYANGPRLLARAAEAGLW
jgi:hypothetical protein